MTLSMPLEGESYTMITFFLLTGLLVLAISFFTKPRLCLPPSPFALPVIGHLHLLGPMIHHSFDKFSLKYGPLVYLRLGSVPCIVASTPEVVKELLKTNETSFCSRNPTLATDHLTYRHAFAFAPYGPYWKLIKKISTTVVLGNQTLNEFLPLRNAEYNQFLRLLMHKSETGQTINISKELVRLTNNVVTQLMLSNRFSGTEPQADEIKTLVREVTKIFGEFNVSDFIWFCRNLDLQGIRKRYEDVGRRYDALMEKIIEEREQIRMKRKEEKERRGEGANGMKDFLDTLLDAMKDENLEVKITKNHIKGLMLDFIAAGTDTTASSIEWALAELINNPMILQKARDEIDNVLGKSRLVGESDIQNLPYLQAIVKETFRLHPPHPVYGRKSTKSCKISGYDIPENTVVFINIWSIGRSPSYWENPFKFLPERFLSYGKLGHQSELIDVKGQNFQLLPFGTGRRGCPGMNLALEQLHTVIAAMIQCFDWTVVGAEGKVGDNMVDMTERYGLTAPRLHDLVCVPVARCSPSILEP